MTGLTCAMRWLPCGLMAIAGPITATAQPAKQATCPAKFPQEHDRQALLASEDMRFRAEASGDAVTLNCLIADDLVYRHLTGMRQDKAAVIAMLAQMHFQNVTPSDRAARVIGDVGFVRGRVVRQLPGQALRDGYVALYVYRDRRWQLLEWASIAPPPG